MIVIIPLLNNTQSPELRYALRSITTHHAIERCILVGGKPNWYTGEHLSFKDYGPVYKEQNIRDKVLAATTLFTGDFLFGNDDHIIMQPIPLVPADKGLLSTCLAGRIGNGSYTRCLRNTLEHYGDVMNVDCHTPMWMNSEAVQCTNFEWPQYGIGFKTCYAQENNLQSIYMPDCKVNAIPAEPVPWFSLADSFRVNTLQNLFPHYCKFEQEYLSC